ncbi:MAG: DegT/DnrJ/EryC1/StrS family aminotransferase [Planctomycetota bacterium]|nr:DegT/DnrJ/EryC1/StrS family aminotransferase [Planctomycetota bacterium]MDA1142420.1 DegT/DnrJ/EryC1/StrS family aminotransferase [Planctomycetota bacterium]
MIPLVDLKAQYESIKDEILPAVAAVFESTQFVLGEAVARFENAFASYCQVEHAIGVNSGTSALHLALESCGIGDGDEVITTPFTFIATTAAIRYTGARPVFVDIDPQSYTIDVNQIEAAITERTKAIIPVHLYGQMADMDPILGIAERHGLVVIEDACQAHGAEYKGRRAGSLGHLGCFSFYPGKNLGAYGEGGLITTNDPEHNKHLRLMRDWGQSQKYHHTLPGFNYRMDGVQGAVLDVKLRHLEEWTEARRRHAARYTELLSPLDIPTPVESPGNRHVYHVYTVRVPQRESFFEPMKEAGISIGIHYPIPVHLQKIHADLGHKAGDFPDSEQVANEVLSLPIFPELTEENIRHVTGTFSSVMESVRAG